MFFFSNVGSRLINKVIVIIQLYHMIFILVCLGSNKYLVALFASDFLASILVGHLILMLTVFAVK